MRIIITTPIYPPEIGGPAIYIKELTKRLAGEHELTVIMYGRLPEKISGVSFICINKNRLLPLRLLSFFYSLLRASKDADLIYSENGASVELPVGLIFLLRRKSFIFHIGDPVADEKIKKNKISKYINNFISNHAKFVIKEISLKLPEILPFDEKPEKEIKLYENSWNMHLKMLKEKFKHATK